MTDLSGQYLGRYYLAERLGEGGMAVVYKAYDTRLERDVAIKIIRSAAFPPDVLDQVLKRFEREAKSLAKLSHPTIVKVHDYGEHDGSPYLVMEYLPGGTLKNLLGKPVPWQDAVRLILPVARGVAYAHQSGLLHRDIKPANILITASGEPMLSDFGIAKLFEGGQSTVLTESGMVIGTPEYMAPEQWTGTTSPSSDLYSLGIVLYEMVAGRKPYVADTPGAILIKQVTEPLPGPRKFVTDLPETVEHVLIKALAKEPGDRYKDVNAFINALENLHVSAPVVPATEPKIIEPTSKVQVHEPVVSIPTQLPSQEDGGTIKIEENRESQKVEDAAISPSSVVRPPSSIKFSRKGIGLLIGGAFLIVAIWLRSPVIGKWFSPVFTEQATATLNFILPSETLEVLQPIETPTLENVPTEVSSPTPVPLPDEITDEKGVTMRLVPAGEFTMGASPENVDVYCESSRYAGNKSSCVDYYLEALSARQVYLDAYYIDTYEVTNALYKNCVNAGMCWPPLEGKSNTHSDYYGNQKYANYPVIFVNWAMAKTYCEWRGGRLPTEAQWEKAARGTDSRIYPWGNDILDCNKANYYGCAGDTTAVGSYEAGKSPYGIYDMSGNVDEWTMDWYGEKYYITSPLSNPFGPDTGERRVARGGGWAGADLYLFTFARSDPYPAFYTSGTGFRCTLSVTSDTQTAPVEMPTPKAETSSSPTEITDERGVTMRLVPAGEFTMGNNNGSDDEKPAHQVNLDAYYMDVYEVTNSLYKACVAVKVCTQPHVLGSFYQSSPIYYSDPQYDNYPVIFVDWKDAKAYCEWRGARLPSEAEWEKAARGTDGRIYPWGEGIDCTYANFSGCGISDTTEIGKYEKGRSPYGLYDMAGNVWEWVEDWYAKDYYATLAQDILDPKGPLSGVDRVRRGGSFLIGGNHLRSTLRSVEASTYWYYVDTGIRCAKSVP